MFEKLLSLLERAPPATADTVGAPFERRDLAVAVLLLELARVDRVVSSVEQATIERIVRDRFGFDAGTAARLIETARRLLDASLEDWVFATAVRAGFGAGERAEIVALLWEVVYADGGLAHFEEALVERLSRQLGIDGDELETARAQAFARVGARRGATDGGMEAE